MGEFRVGDLVKVGDSLGVVTHFEDHTEIPEDHVGVWYGESNSGLHLVKTVPVEYCTKLEQVEFYH